MNGFSPRGKIAAALAVLLGLLPGLPIATSAGSTESTGGFLGQKLPEVEHQNFFTGYSLAEVARKETPYNARVVVFKPGKTPVPFEVATTVDKREHVLAIQLWVRRSFVDGNEGRSGTRDIILKFLREGPPPEDVRRLTELINEIQHGDVANHSAVGSESTGTKPPSKPSPAYLAFTGKQKSYQQPLGTSVLQILNYRDRFGEVLILQLTPIGHGKREQAALVPAPGPRL
jgi:hypothetical protein